MKGADKYRILFENMNEGFTLYEVMYDISGNPSDFRYIEVNKAYEHLTGLKAVDIIGKPLSQIVLDIEPSWFELLLKVVITGEPLQLDTYNRSTKKYYDNFTFCPKKDYVALLIRDTTEQKLAQEALKERERLLSTIIENSRDGIYLYDLEAGKYVFMSPTQVKLSGFSLEEINSLSREDAYERVHPEDRKLFIEQRKQLTQGMDIASTITYRWKVKSGEYRWFSNSRKLVRNTQGRPVTMVGVNRDITEQKEQQELLTRNQEEKYRVLQQTIEMKDEFLSLVSHEFRTPLTVIISAIQAMEVICKSELSNKAKGFLNKIRQNSYRQLKLVNNLLDITQINSGRFKIRKSNFDIVFLSRSITESISVFAEQKSIDLSFSTTLKKKFICIDDEKYERILLNLLSNAIKFTPKGKSINVKVSQRVIKGKYKVCIQVKDEGIGIPNDKKETIFERFGQVDNSITRQAEGTGIGLSLVKMMVELLGGEITLESKEGVGSTFTVILPAEKSKDAPIEPVQNERTNDRLIQAMNIEFSDIYM